VRVGFFCQSEKHLDLASHLIASVRKTMPKVEVYHLTDGHCPAAEGAKVLRIAEDMPMAVRRMTHHATLPGEWLFIDSDCILQKDVRHVFDDDFDIAVTDRKGSRWDNTAYAEVMPYNMGVTFSKSPDFWVDVLKKLKTLPPKLQEWEGDQLTVCHVSRDWKTKVLPGHIYNFTPWKREDDRSHAAIVHYKGGRKAWAND
jgi:hypothetical protein